ncbi:MAG: signal peptide peptidase SppA [Planctomycetaceae bacterium]|nr:signal peptide peptidase SppA [Planctomycetaceae bacterium]
MASEPTDHESSSADVEAPGSETGGPVPRSRFWGWAVGLLAVVLAGSLLANWGQYQLWQLLAEEPREVFHSGEEDAEAKLAILPINGVIMPPLTGRVLSIVDRIEKDKSVRGLLLAIDSPGGLVADSHQIYHRLERYRSKTGNPVFVTMSRMATSGGLYVAMGGGPQVRVFAEPTTWTGSIGVIIPRYDLSGLASELGVNSDPLKTGPLKDSLNPFRKLSDQDRVVWRAILDDAFDRFVGVVATNRPRLDEAGVRRLATGQIYTASQALENGLVDELGYEEDAIAALRSQLKLARARVVTYRSRSNWIDLLLGQSRSPGSSELFREWLEGGVPRAMYLSSWGSLPPPILD